MAFEEIMPSSKLIDDHLEKDTLVENLREKITNIIDQSLGRW